MKEKISWNLDDILAVKDFGNLYKEIERELKRAKDWLKKLSTKMSKAKFKKIMEADEELGEKMSRLAYLPQLMEAVNQKDQKAKVMKTKVNNLQLKAAEILRPMSHWLKGKKIKGKERLDDKNAKRLFGAIKDLEYGLSFSREAARYTLEQKEEEIIDNKDVNGIGALVDLRNMIDTEQEYDLRIEGKKVRKIKTASELLALTRSTKSTDRRAAYDALFGEYKKNLDKYFVIYQAVVKDWNYEVRLRGFKSAIGMRNFYNQVPDKAVENLLEVCSLNRGVFQKYFLYKAKRLGLTKLKRSDIYAPIAMKKKKYGFKESQDLVLETMADFSPKMKNLAEKIIQERHIDVFPSPVKESGAFCATVSPKISPYIMLNWVGEERDVYTLAHELGHGVHSLYANKHYPSSQHANLPLSETASTLAEMVVFERLYRLQKDKEIKRAMLSEKMADSYATILRQNYFVIFEKQAFEAVEKGISSIDLSKIYFNTLKEQFGQSVEVEKIFEYEWAYISHLVNSPFYCYAYNFGELLSYGLFARYKNEGKKMVAKIEKVLAAGGSREPKAVLKEIGIDMEDKGLWQDGFEIIKDWQKELETD